MQFKIKENKLEIRKLRGVPGGVKGKSSRGLGLRDLQVRFPGPFISG